MTANAPRRIVTGHDGDGRSVVLSDDPTPASQTIATGVTFHPLWSTAGSPAPIRASEPAEPTARELSVTPDPQGTILHVIDMPPGSSAPLHRTSTIDYGIVLEGEVDLELDDGSRTRMSTGDVAIQRGTAHAWYNRSQGVTRLLFVQIDGAFTDELRSTLGEQALSEVLTAPLK
jgi:quercetin dioxygenase-like cupin family protein